VLWWLEKDVSTLTHSRKGLATPYLPLPTSNTALRTAAAALLPGGEASTAAGERARQRRPRSSRKQRSRGNARAQPPTRRARGRGAASARATQAVREAGHAGSGSKFSASIASAGSLAGWRLRGRYRQSDTQQDCRRGERDTLGRPLLTHKAAVASLL